jgi:hypothetical protein
MAELFEPHKDQERVQNSDEEQQFARDCVVLGFFFVVFAGALMVFAGCTSPAAAGGSARSFLPLVILRFLAVFEIHEKGLA